MGGIDKWILVNGEPQPCDDPIIWARWMESGNRVVQKDDVSPQVRVSTVFLGLDHSFGVGPPLLYETMIFGGPHDSYQDRYTTKEAARVGHELALALAKAGVP